MNENKYTIDSCYCQGKWRGKRVYLADHAAIWNADFIPMLQRRGLSAADVGKYAGEQALRQRQPELTNKGIRLIVVTGDLVDGTITPKLLERSAPTVIDQRRQAIGATLGQLPTATEMGEAIAVAATDAKLPGGHTVIVGGSLESLLSL